MLKKIACLIFKHKWKEANISNRICERCRRRQVWVRYVDKKNIARWKKLCKGGKYTLRLKHKYIKKIKTYLWANSESRQSVGTVCPLWDIDTYDLGY